MISNLPALQWPNFLRGKIPGGYNPHVDNANHFADVLTNYCFTVIMASNQPLVVKGVAWVAGALLKDLWTGVINIGAAANTRAFTRLKAGEKSALIVYTVYTFSVLALALAQIFIFPMKAGMTLFGALGFNFMLGLKQIPQLVIQALIHNIAMVVLDTVVTPLFGEEGRFQRLFVWEDRTIQALTGGLIKGTDIGGGMFYRIATWPMLYYASKVACGALPSWFHTHGSIFINPKVA